MLCLCRRVDEIIDIGSDISIMVLSISDDKVRLGITAPKEVPVNRREVTIRIQREQSHVHGETD